MRATHVSDAADRENVPGAPPAFEVTAVGVGTTARTGQGLRLETTPLPDLDRAPDLLVVPLQIGQVAQALSVSERTGLVSERYAKVGP